jgi:polysaccharide export outer membrane protein
MKNLRHITATLFTALALAFLTGCQPFDNSAANNNHAAAVSNPQGDVLNVGEPITVTFSDAPTLIQPFEERIKSDGKITLLYSQTFDAAGKTRGDLEAEIRERYVPRYFKNLTVTIRTVERAFFVGGEVRMPGRYPYSGEMTVSKAIFTAGGFTDYAKRSKVLLTRANRQTLTVDSEAALENPALDLPVFPNDSITVPRRL